MSFQIPASCTLPTARQPVRVAEWEALLATARTRRRVSGRHLRLTFDGTDRIGALRDLAERESGCCSFFEFDVGTDDEHVVLDVVVPAGWAEVLDGLAELAGGGAR